MSCRTLLKTIFGLCLACASYVYAQSGTDCCQTEAKGNNSQDEIIAVINGRRISKHEVDSAIAAQIHSLEQKIYELRRKALESLINRILIEDEAKRRGISVEQLRRELVAGVKVEDSEVEAEYNSNLAQLGPPPVSEIEAKERIRAIIESRKRAQVLSQAISDWRSKSKIEIYLKEPQPIRIQVSDGGPSLGSRMAPVTIVEFSDFQCPYCKRANDILKQVLQIYGEDVRLVYKHMPLPNHEHAFKAAQAATCAGEQGKFWQYHDILFERSSDLSEVALRKYAADLGLNSDEFNKCLNSEASRAVVIKDLQEARQAGISSTPTFVINGRVLRGTVSLEVFKAAIDEALKEQKTQRTAIRGRPQ